MRACGQANMWTSWQGVNINRGQGTAWKLEKLQMQINEEA
jgi:hypothetical protein